ncbi:MAG TPA: tetratricopeptide repeat protein [Patescibacteria group bacterium]|nr:tetratricopeptide repeat protein [Patescibacteria group bacterium]
MKSLSTSQKLIALILAAIIIIIVGIGLVFKFTNKKNNTSVTPVQNTVQNTNNEQTQTPAQDVKKNYNQIVKEITTKQQNGAATAEDLFNLGVAYYNLGKLDSAEKVYLQAIEKDPTDARSYSNLANVYRDQGKYSESETNYKKSISLDAKNYKVYISLAFLYNNLMNKAQEAIGVLNQGLSAIPGNPEMKNLLAQYSK